MLKKKDCGPSTYSCCTNLPLSSTNFVGPFRYYYRITASIFVNPFWAADMVIMDVSAWLCCIVVIYWYGNFAFGWCQYYQLALACIQEFLFFICWSSCACEEIENWSGTGACRAHSLLWGLTASNENLSSFSKTLSFFLPSKTWSWNNTCTQLDKVYWIVSKIRWGRWL